MVIIYGAQSAAELEKANGSRGRDPSPICVNLRPSAVEFVFLFGCFEPFFGPERRPRKRGSAPGFRFCSFSERGPESMVLPREAIYAEAAWIVLCNPIGFYDGVGGAGR